MMKCPACGARYSASERLCPKDGAVLEHEQSLEEQFIGKTLDGKYRLDSFISRGGMGAVFRGMHVMLDRPVAVKMINADLVSSPEIVRRFQREARAATQLNHPNIVDVYDLGQTGEGTLYIAMELVTGQSLKDEIRARGALDAKRIVHIMSQVCDGLGVAHKANIVHRDLKPQNIMLTRDRAGAELAKIVDFGIAKTFEVDSHTQLTADGSTLGTPHYMSPEQATGREIDGRSDIYSLGIILYEMLTGEVPFDDQSLPAVLVKHMSEAPAPPSQRRPDLAISPALEAIALRCLAKDPAARYATADELGAALRAATPSAMGDATIAMGSAAAAATVPMSAATPPPPLSPLPTPPAAAAANRPATHPTAPAVPPPVPPAAPAAAAPAAVPAAATTMRSSRGPAVLVAAFLLLMTVAAGAGYWMWSRNQGPVEMETITADGAPPTASPAANTPPTESSTPSTPAATTQPSDSPATSSGATTTPAATATETPAAPVAPATPPTSAPRATETTSARTSPPPSSAATPPRASASTSKPSASTTAAAPASAPTAPGASTSAPGGADKPGAPSATQALPENPTVSFQCRGSAEICTPLRNEIQASFERAGMSLRRAGADINITAEAEQTGQDTQQSFGTTLTVKTFAVQLEAESPRFDNDAISMPNTPPVSADSRLGGERFSEYARKIAPEVVERVRAFWSKRRQ
jgi:serine/threonine protein kinase